MRTVIIVLIAMSIFAVSCKKDEKAAPAIPPESAFVMDMSDFNDAAKYSDETYYNFSYSVLNVAVWHSILSVGMAVPVASYLAVINNDEPVYQSDQTWLWSYDFPVGEQLFSAGLYGTISNDSVEWKMYITKEGVYKDFLWYRGKSALDRSGGYWILYESPSNNHELLEIVWNRNSAASGQIKYTNIRQGGAENGGFIHYGNDGEGAYSSFYDIYNKGKAQLTKIQWDTVTKAGRVKDTVHFGDENWQCWSSTLEDIECEE